MTADEISALREAIAALEAQRAILGDAVVETALAPLQEKLLALTRAAPPADERKRVTILFSDLAGFTAMSETLDPEDVHAIIDAYFARMNPAITRFGGVIEKYIGDAVMALFGAPHALENHEEMAVRAALAMQQALDEYNQELERERGLQLAMRIGLNTGLVMYGAMGGKASSDFTVIGDAVNLASRLEHAAPVGGILVSSETAQRLHAIFEFEPPQQVTVKGKAEPITVYVVRGEKAQRGQVRGLAGLHAPMVGREREMAALQESFTRAVDDKNWQVAMLVGEAGIGKSRLRREFVAWVKQAHPQTRLVIGRCYAHTRDTPYSLVADIVRSLFQIDAQADTATTLAQLAERVRVLDPAVNETEFRYRLASLASILGLPLPDNPLHALAPEQRRDRVFLSLEWMLLAVSAVAPMPIILDDLHWADTTSCAVVERWAQVARRGATGNHTAFFLLISRPAEEPNSPLDQLIEQLSTPPCLALRLSPLDEGQSTALVSALLAGVDLPAELLTLITARAQGNPFFVEELLRTLIENKCLTHDPASGRWRVTQHVAELDVPGTVQGVLAARLDRLPPLDKQILQRAAVSGRVFWQQLLARISQDGQNVEQAVQETLDRLQARQLVLQMGESQVINDWEWAFRHALTQEVAYASLPRGVRQRIHAQVARWLEERIVEQQSTFIPLIAYHYDQGNVPQKAAIYLRRAGEQAAAQFANDDAVRYLSRAIELAPPADEAERYALLLARENVLHLQGAREVQAQDLSLLAQLADTLDDDRRRAEAALRRARYAQATSDFSAAIAATQEAARWGEASRDSVLQASAHLGWGDALLSQGAYEAARPQLEQALELAMSAEAHQVAAHSRHALGRAAFDQGDYAQATADYEWALDIYRASSDRRGEASVLNSLGVACWKLGEYDRARSYYHQVLQIRRETGDRRGEAGMLNNLGVIFQELARHDEALDYYEQSLHIARQIEERRGEAVALENSGITYISQGQYSRASANLETALSIYCEIGDRCGESNALNNLGYVASLQGDYATARRYFEQALVIYRQVGNRWGEGIVLDDLGFVAHHQGDDAAALDYAQQSLQVSGELADRSTQAYALIHLGHALLGLDRPDEAAAAYQHALDLRQEIGQQNRAMEGWAGRAQVAMAKGELEQAQACVEPILQHLQDGNLEGCQEPFWIYVTCYRALQRSGDPRAPQLLAEAHRLLQERAQQIPDAQLRRSFLENIAAHREIVQAFEK
ncbi:MAG: tetratricopeptide repeat protein [Anaerolineae bacterium]|nr:tetratricopeptide repeat protein [Anaerolineae bacterium]